MDEWLKTSSAGSLRAHGSLAKLSSLSPAERERCTNLNLPETFLTGDVNADKENESPSIDG